MDIQQIAEEARKLKPKAHKRFVENLIILLQHVERSVALRGPYRLVLDSNILMRLESYRLGNITEGLLSVLLLFIFLRRLPFPVDTVVRPSVFLEFLRLKNVESTREHWEKFKELKLLIEDKLGVTLFFDGIETYSGALHYGSLIERDAKKIENLLRDYQEREWRFDFIRQPGGFDGVLLKNGWIEVAPFFAAQGLYTELGLEYFDERKASRFFIEHIEKHLVECPHNDQRVIDKYAEDNPFLLTKVLRLTAKGNLVGLADIDIFSLCNVQSQFADQAHGRYFPASIGLSIDENLSRALFRFSSIHLTSAQMLGGDENLNDNFAKMEAWVYDQKRIQEGEKRERLVWEKSAELIDELRALHIFDVSS